MKRQKQKFLGVIVLSIITVLTFSLSGCDNPNGNGGSGGGNGSGNGSGQQHRFPANVNERNAFIAAELQRLAQECGQVDTDTGRSVRGCNHLVDGMPGIFWDDASPENLQALANLIAQCRLNDIRQINEEVFAERGVRKNIHMTAQFGLNQGWLIQSGQAANIHVVQQRSNPNAPANNEQAFVNSVGVAGGVVEVKSFDN